MRERTASPSLVMVIATCSQPIPFGEMPVRLIFLIGIPKRAGADYLELISFLARHVRGERVVDRLVQAEDMSSFLVRIRRERLVKLEWTRPGKHQETANSFSRCCVVCSG